MTKEEEDAKIEVICARLGMPKPKAYNAEWAGLLLELEAEHKAKKSRKPDGPMRRPGPKVRFFSWLLTLLYSRKVSDLMQQNPKMSEIQACKKICQELRKQTPALKRKWIKDQGMQDILKEMRISDKTLKRKIIALRTQRDKFIKDEKWKARLLYDRDGFIVSIKCFRKDKDAADAEISYIFDIVAEYLGEDDREATLKRMNEAWEKVAVRNP
jgi:hypothetical protein